MFHRVFPEIKFSASSLHRTYKRFGISFKYIKRGKKAIDYRNQYYFNLFQEMYLTVKKTRLSDKKLVWIDEAVFTFNTFRKRAWSAKYSSISVKDCDMKIKTMALIAAISEDGGLEAYSIHSRSINSEDFVAFIQILASKFHGIEFAMFMDNLRVHKTKAVLEACRLHQVSTIYNVPYSPDFNGIESYFSLVKG